MVRNRGVPLGYSLQWLHSRLHLPNCSVVIGVTFVFVVTATPFLGVVSITLPAATGVV
jgi:hypothetical protein